jgi:hypothetical protein
MELAKKFIEKSPTMRITQEEKDEVCRRIVESIMAIGDLRRPRLKEYQFTFDNLWDLTNSPISIQVKTNYC